jgi:hypothetical protein
MKPSKSKVLINGHGQCKFYVGLDPQTHEMIIGIDHPEMDTVVFLSATVLAGMNGWLARKKPTLQPLTLN